MKYDRPELLDRLASEYAFGTLQGRARRRFERLRLTHPAADVAARDWEARLSGLAAAVPAVIPRAGVWAAIDRRTGGTEPVSRVRAWRGWWIPTFAAAFAVVATLGVVRMAPTLFVPVDAIVQERGMLPASYVGLLTDAEGVPTVLASATRHGNRMTLKILRPIAVPPGKVLQMWALPRDGAPFPLGVVPASDKGAFVMPGTSEQLLSSVPRLAVSIEDRPAARGDVPGPFIFTGHCVKLW